MRLSLEKLSNVAIFLLAAFAVVQMWNLYSRPGSWEKAGTGEQFTAEDPVFHQILPVVASEQPGTMSSIADLVRGGCALVYFFDPECSACNKYASAWSGIGVLEADSVALNLRWISVRSSPEEISRYVEKHGLVGDVYELGKEYSPMTLGLKYVPQSFVVGPAGETLSWGGHIPVHAIDRLNSAPDLFVPCSTDSDRREKGLGAGTGES